MGTMTINSGAGTILQLNEILSGNNTVKFFNISNESAPNNVIIEFELITIPETAVSPYLTLGAVPAIDNFGNPAELTNLGDILQYNINNLTSSNFYNILFGGSTVLGDTATVRCKLLSTNVDGIPIPNFIDISTVNYDTFGVLEVQDCVDESGVNTLVYGVGTTNGQQIFKQSDGLPFPGGNQFYRVTEGGSNQFYMDFTGLIVSGYIIQIDNSGFITTNTICP